MHEPVDVGVRPGRGQSHRRAAPRLRLTRWKASRRIADAVAVRRIGTPFDVVEVVSNVKSYGEGPVMIWFLEDYRDDVVLVVRVQHFELSDPAGLGCMAALTRRWLYRCR